MEVRLAEFEMNDRTALSFEFLGAGKDSQRSLAGQLGYARCNVCHGRKIISLPYLERG
jgi:hypothetical protein